MFFAAVGQALLALGYFAATLMAMVSRVSSGHSGRKLVAFGAWSARYAPMYWRAR